MWSFLTWPLLVCQSLPTLFTSLLNFPLGITMDVFPAYPLQLFHWIYQNRFLFGYQEYKKRDTLSEYKMKQWKYHNFSLEYVWYLYFSNIYFIFAGVLLKGLTKRNLMDLNMSTHCLCQLKTKSNQRIHVQRNLKIVHFIAFIQYDRYINAAILIHTYDFYKIKYF